MEGAIKDGEGFGFGTSLELAGDGSLEGAVDIHLEGRGFLDVLEEDGLELRGRAGSLHLDYVLQEKQVLLAEQVGGEVVK